MANKPSAEAIGGMNCSTWDTAHVFVQATGELWVMSTRDDPVDYVDHKGRGWHWEPDPRPPKKVV